MNLMEESNSSSGLLFSELKGYCLQLLHLLQNPPNNQNHNSIIIFNNLFAFIRQSSSHHLQPFFNYTLFPLVLLLEAAVECRNNPPPLKISDAVAEGMLRCLEHLLIKCHVPSLDQMVVLLKKLTNAALLSPSQASEEIRVEAFMTLRVLVAKVGTADQLAFFLTGVVSQIGKVLHVSKTIISGAAGSMEAMDQALRYVLMLERWLHSSLLVHAAIPRYWEDPSKKKASEEAATSTEGQAEARGSVPKRACQDPNLLQIHQQLVLVVLILGRLDPVSGALLLFLY